MKQFGLEADNLFFWYKTKEFARDNCRELYARLDANRLDQAETFYAKPVDLRTDEQFAGRLLGDFSVSKEAGGEYSSRRRKLMALYWMLV